MTENEIAKIIVDAAYKVHVTLGPGLLESVYEAILDFELKKRGLKVSRQHVLPVRYESVTLDMGFRTDLIVENKVIVELKSVEEVAPGAQEAVADILAPRRQTFGPSDQFWRCAHETRYYESR